MGSFTTALAYRLPRGLPFSHDPQGRPVRSICPPCGRTLRARELIPVLSWVWQRGRCACGKIEISLRYPMIEMAVLTLTLIVGYRHGVDLVDTPRFLVLPFVAAIAWIGASASGGWPRQIDGLVILLAMITVGLDLIFASRAGGMVFVPLFCVAPLVLHAVRVNISHSIWRFLSFLPLVGFLL